MSLERSRKLIVRFRELVASHEAAPGAPSFAARDPELAVELFESMLLARHLDVAAHELKARGRGHYTICSSGHEANVVLGRLTRVTDPTMVHYRSAALFLERARQDDNVDGVLEIARSLVASSRDSIAGGRHKVFGSRPLGIIPQTSTIASHLPRAVGLAFGIERRRRLGLEPELPADTIAVASFGDASINHSTAQGALNAASWTAHQRMRLPLLFVCEDNGLGISVPSPPGWVEMRLMNMPHVRYFTADGADLLSTWQAAARAVQHCRTTRRPAVLHVKCVRLLGHAGSDVDTAYRTPQEIEAALGRDPVARAALRLIDAKVADRDQVLAMDDAAERRVREATTLACEEPGLGSREQIMACIPPIRTETERAAATPSEWPTGEPALTLAQGINRALREALRELPELLVFGEDVGLKGGVYGVTKGLSDEAGRARVFDTLLDEQTILGLALGTATLGLLPVPEIQYLAYLHNAEDQLRGEAATLPFFSQGAYDNPLVVRIAGFAYQKGFGGHFHNDNAVAVLRDIPGLVVGVPARADDALAMYRSTWELTRRRRRVVVLIEPIALYHTRDLFSEGDEAWTAPPSNEPAALGEVRVYEAKSPRVVIATYGNGVYLSRRAARRLERDHGIAVRVLDLRWLAPLPTGAVIDHGRQIGRLLVVDECRQSGSPSEAIATAVLDCGAEIAFARVTSADSFVPLGAAACRVLVSEDEIVDAAKKLAQR